MSISDYAEDKVLDAIFNASTTGGGLPTVDPYIQLHNGDPGEAGTTNVVNVARVQVPFAAASGGTLANTGNIDVASMPTDTVVAWSLWDAAGSGGPPTGGNCLWTGWLSTVAVTIQVDDEDIATDDIESPTHGFTTDDRIVFEALESFTVPTGIVAGTLYYVLAAGLVDDMFRVSTASGGGTLNITAEGQCVARKVVPRPTTSGDTFRIATGDLDIFLD